jgi:hypothetical protein
MYPHGYVMHLNFRERSIPRRRKTYIEFICAIFFFGIFPITSFSEDMDVGTFVVVAQTKRFVVIAGDSRMGETDDGITIKRTDDGKCKIVAPGGHTAFAASGVIGNSREAWSAISEAINAAGMISHDIPMSSAQGDKLLDAWAKLVLRHLNEFSGDQLAAVTAASQGNVTTAVLAGVERDGSAWLRGVMIRYNASGLSYQGYTMTSADPPSAYYNLGKGDIAREFEEADTDRATAERDAWVQLNLSGLTFDRFKTNRLVNLTIELIPDKSTVGGLVDQIEVDAQGVRWDALKSQCQVGDAKPPP